jgi:hypothetical protein
LSPESDPEEIHPTVQNAFVRKYYAFFAIFAGIIYGTVIFLQSMIIEREDSHFSLTLFLPMLAGYWITHNLYHLKEAIKSKRRDGVFWLKERSAYL